MMARRFDSYVAHVVRPFFRDHFARLDRQIVLVDVLGAFNGGAECAERDGARRSPPCSRPSGPGSSSWLAGLGGRRIDRLLFAATKADHIHHSSHDRLEALLKLLTERASARAPTEPAPRSAFWRWRRSGQRGKPRRATARACCRASSACRCRARRWPARRSTAGARWRSFRAISRPIRNRARPGKTGGKSAGVVSEVPPAAPRRADARGEIRPAPHIRLDRALDFLIGDWLQ